MQPLVPYLRNNFKWSPAEVEKFLKNDFAKLKTMLEGEPIYTGHSERHDPLLLEEITVCGAEDIRVNTGSMESSLPQFVYSRYGILLKQPKLPCLIQRSNVFSLDVYYPLELVLIDRK
jgi:hypothetical protein